MTFYRARYGGTSAPNYDDLTAEQHHWPAPDSVIEVGPVTAAHLAYHELFTEVVDTAAPQLDDPDTDDLHPVTEPAPLAPVTGPAHPTHPVTEPSPVTAPAAEPDDPEGDEDDIDGENSTTSTPRKRRRRTPAAQ